MAKQKLNEASLLKLHAQRSQDAFINTQTLAKNIDRMRTWRTRDTTQNDTSNEL